jgi:hypothetical protein
VNDAKVADGPHSNFIIPLAHSLQHRVFYLVFASGLGTKLYRFSGTDFMDDLDRLSWLVEQSDIRSSAPRCAI